MLDSANVVSYKEVKFGLKGFIMMELTREGDYAIRGITYLARQAPGHVSLIGEIAAGSGTPKSFLSKIFQGFVKLGLVTSTRGTKGGYILARPASLITLREVVEAVEGPIAPNFCLYGNSDPCGPNQVRNLWGALQNRVVNMLDNVTIESLVASIPA